MGPNDAHRIPIECVLCCMTHSRASISNFIYRALDLHVSAGIVMGTNTRPIVEIATDYNLYVLKIESHTF